MLSEFMVNAVRQHERPAVVRTPPTTEGRFVLLVAATSLLAALISATGSWIPSLWGDEAASVMSATRSVPSLLRMLGSVDAVHGAYYVGLHAWVDLIGTSPFVVRLPSALAVGATVAAVMIVARDLGTIRVACAAGLICAVIPRVTYMGAEARSSAMAAAIAAWLTVLLIVILRRPTPAARWWLTYAALLAVGIYVFLYVVLIAVAHLFVVVSIRAHRQVLVRWAVSVAAAVVVATPLLAAALVERQQIAFLAHRDEVTFSKLAVSLWFGSPLFAGAAWALIGVAAVAGVRARRSTGVLSVVENRMPRPDVVAASWLFVPAVILVGGSALVPVYTARYLSFCAPAAALLMAVGLDHLARQRMRVVAAGLAIVIGCAAPVWLSQREPHAKNHSDLADTSLIIAAHASPGDAVVFDENVRPSRRPRLALHLYPQAFSGLRDITLNVPYTNGTSWHDTALPIPDAVALGRFNGVNRVWYVDYSVSGEQNQKDRAAFAALGYTPVHAFTTVRSVVTEYEFASAQRAGAHD